MKKEIIVEKIFYSCKRASNFSKPYMWGEIKKMLQQKNIQLMDDDILEIGFEEGWEEGDSAREDMYFVSIKRKREETDSEFNERKIRNEKHKEDSRKKKYKLYIELKKEFEN